MPALSRDAPMCAPRSPRAAGPRCCSTSRAWCSARTPLAQRAGGRHRARRGQRRPVRTLGRERDSRWRADCRPATHDAAAWPEGAIGRLGDAIAQCLGGRDRALQRGRGTGAGRRPTFRSGAHPGASRPAACDVVQRSVRSPTCSTPCCVTKRSTRSSRAIACRGGWTSPRGARPSPTGWRGMIAWTYIQEWDDGEVPARSCWRPWSRRSRCIARRQERATSLRRRCWARRASRRCSRIARRCSCSTCRRRRGSR